jgi:hypothetical protein
MASSPIAPLTYWQNQDGLFVGTLRGIVRTRSRATSRRHGWRYSNNFIRFGLFLMNVRCTSESEFV